VNVKTGHTSLAGGSRNIWQGTKARSHGDGEKAHGILGRRREEIYDLKIIEDSL